MITERRLWDAERSQQINVISTGNFDAVMFVDEEVEGLDVAMNLKDMRHCCLYLESASTIGGFRVCK
jgi:hypothetical protein